MNIQQALKQRIQNLCQERNVSFDNYADRIGENTTIEDIELICNQLGISLADFFVNDLFQNIL